MTAQNGAPLVDPGAGEIRTPLQFILISFCSLFLEVLLIRWLGTEVRIFAYFSNLVLVTCFLGLGVGYATKRLRLSLVHSMALTALLLLLCREEFEIFGLSFRRIPTLLAFSDLNTWTIPVKRWYQPVAGTLLLSFLLVLLLLIFVPFGRALGDYFERSKARLRDYSINVTASIAGIWAFAACCFQNAQPWLWVGIAMLVLLPTVARNRTRAVLALVLVVAAMGLVLPPPVPELPGVAASEGVKGGTYWSPYHKLTLHPKVPEGPEDRGGNWYLLEVNSTLYQFVLDFRPETQRLYPRIFPPEEVPYFYYNLPYRMTDKLDEVLVVGAGTGNDVAAALRNGAGHVDAVEIDPVIIDLGRQAHPEAPYSSDRVTVITDDARSYFKRSKKKYDMVLFGLLDSHRLTSNFSNTNLDSFVYTKESLAEVHQLLSPDGFVSLSFQAFYPYIYKRLYSMLTEEFGSPPIRCEVKQNYNSQGAGGFVFFAGNFEKLRAQINRDKGLQKAFSRWPVRPNYETASTPRPATDDWPFLYLRSPGIPRLWGIIIGVLFLLGLAILRVDGVRVRDLDLHFFFLGAAFLLLETHTISRAALFFGSTWIVTSVVITAVLIMVLFGNALASRLSLRRAGVFYVPLLLIAVGNYFLWPGTLQAMGLAGGWVLALTACLPLMFAAVLFGTGLKTSTNVKRAFFSNLLGAMVGGILQCASFVTGLQLLVLGAALLYLLSWFFRSRSRILPA